MKSIYLLISISVFFLYQCNHKKDNVKTKNTTHIYNSSEVNNSDLKFINKVVNFGILPKDTIVNAKYLFTNTSTKKLIINSVNPDCTCTGFNISKDTVPPKDTAYITLHFNTANKYGSQKIYAIVNANTKVKLYKLMLIAKVK